MKKRVSKVKRYVMIDYRGEVMGSYEGTSKKQVSKRHRIPMSRLREALDW